MFDKNTLHQAWQNASAPKPQVKKPQKAGGIGGFLEGLLPTAGGTAGSLGGAAAGAGIGTLILPGIGTGIGALLGGALGGAGGSAAGKVGENALEGQKLSSGVGKEALLGGVTGVPLLTPLKVGGALAKGVLTGTTKEAVGNAVTKAAGKTIAEKGVLGRNIAKTNELNPTTIAKQANGVRSPVASAGAKARTYSNNLLANDLNISAKDAEKFRGPQTLQSLQDKYGITARQAAQLHPIVTGGEGATTEALNNSLENVGKINFSDFSGSMKKELDDPEFLAANGLSKSQAKNLSSTIDKYHDTLNAGNQEALTSGNATGYKIESGTNAKAAMDTAKDLEKKGYNNTSSSSDAKNATGEMQLKMADFIKRRIYNSPKGQEALSAAKEESASQLENLAKASGNKSLNKIASDVRNAKTFEEYRNVSAPFVNAKGLIDKTETNNFANKGQNNTPGQGGIFQTGARIASKVVSPVAAKGLSKVANVAENATEGTTSGVIPLALRTAARQGITRSVVNPEVPQESDNSQLSGLSSDTAQPPQSQDTTQSQNIFANQDVIQQLLLSDISKTGGKNLSTILSLYNAFKPDQTSATQQSAIASAEGAQNTLGTLSNLYQQAGGGAGPIGGTLENIAGNLGLNSNVGAYNQIGQGLVAQIAKAMGNTGTLSDTDIKLAQNLIPKTTDTSDQAQIKLQSLQQMLNNALQNAQNGYGASSLGLVSQ